MSHSQFNRIKSLYLDMHGLIFETSIWLLAESTKHTQHSGVLGVFGADWYSHYGKLCEGFLKN